MVVVVVIDTYSKCLFSTHGFGHTPSGDFEIGSLGRNLIDFCWQMLLR